MLRQRGFSLIEMMVATALALLTGLAVLQVLTNYQTRQQTTSGRNDSQISAAIGLYQLEREIRMAGAGLISSQGFICNVGINTYNGATVSNGAPLHPLRITEGGTGPDMIDVIHSNARTGAAPATVLQVMTAASTKILVDSTTGLLAGDLYVVGSNDGSKVCSLQQLNVAAENNVTTWYLHHDAAVNAPYNPPDPGTAFTSPVVYDVGDMIVAIGTAWQTRQQLLCSDNTGLPSTSNTCNLVSYDLYRPPANLNLASVTNWAGQAYDLQAQYGVADVGSQTVNAWVDATGIWSAATLTNANIRRIKAVRLALITRGAQQATVVSPEQLVLWGSGSTQRVRLLSTAERYYRYTVLTTVIPLVNIIWAGM
jgi:type IV pilus assembly protein PilW